MNRNIVAGQLIDAVKLDFARRLRRTMTPAETLLWGSLRGRRVSGLKFRRQQIIDGYIADLYCAEVGLVVELDGPIHDSQIEYDALRDSVMAARGLTILRIPNRRIGLELEQVLNEIATFAPRTHPPTMK